MAAFLALIFNQKWTGLANFLHCSPSLGFSLLPSANIRCINRLLHFLHSYGFVEKFNKEGIGLQKTNIQSRRKVSKKWWYALED
ncbi:hypothetical protein SAMN06272759_11419 [Novosphingobium sp. B1]|nr:hypothetical protein SAMN06272759_11419 [Novosphingobium sp. B1]